MKFSVRFDDLVLHQAFLQGVARSGAVYQLGALDAVECDESAWGAVNSAAHVVRDSCFRWYFSWADSVEGSQAFLSALRASGLPFQLEHRERGYVFLLAQEHRRAYHKLALLPP